MKSKSTWLREYHYKWYEKLAMNIVKVGPIPYHIAFIMDGNRRYAKNANISRIDGHSKGFEKLAECLRWCLDVGVKEVTTFAFSIENFKRSEDEVKQLMDLAKTKFIKLLEEENELCEKGVRIRIIGNLNLLPDDLKSIMAKVVLMTENNNKLFLNIAFAYTSHEELTNSLHTIVENYDDCLQSDDININLLRYCLYTKESPDPDLLIRTSGETRISDFLMWQISATVLYFTKTFWPAITIWHFFGAMITYQRQIASIWIFKRQIQKEQINNSDIDNDILPDRVQNFIQKLDQYQHNNIEKLAANAKFKKLKE